MRKMTSNKRHQLMLLAKAVMTTEPVSSCLSMLMGPFNNAHDAYYAIQTFIACEEEGHAPRRTESTMCKINLIFTAANVLQMLADELRRIAHYTNSSISTMEDKAE